MTLCAATGTHNSLPSFLFDFACLNLSHNNRRALIFTFPYNVIHMFRNLFICLIVSILCGVIYWHVRVGREQEHLWDRIGLYHALLAVAPLPFFLIIMNDGTSSGTQLFSLSLSLSLSLSSLDRCLYAKKRQKSLPELTQCLLLTWILSHTHIHSSCRKGVRFE